MQRLRYAVILFDLNLERLHFYAVQEIRKILCLLQSHLQRFVVVLQPVWLCVRKSWQQSYCNLLPRLYPDRPISLPLKADASVENKTLLLSGWGFSRVLKWQPAKTEWNFQALNLSRLPGLLLSWPQGCNCSVFKLERQSSVYPTVSGFVFEFWNTEVMH